MLVALAGLGCERAPATQAEALAVAYRSAASEFDVPRPLLEAMGYVETRWWMRPGVAAVDGGYGVMHLVDAGPDSPLPRAAALLGVAPERLKTEVETNIRGAAALLRERADRYFAETPAKDPRNVAAWWQVVMHQSGAFDAKVADEYAAQVFHQAGRGAREVLPDGSVYEQAAHPIDVTGEAIFAEVESPLTPDYASASWRPALRWTSGRSATPIDVVVVHTAQGSYTGTVSWFQNPQVRASAHYVVSSGGAVTQMVENQHTAWHAGNWEYNERSIGIEHEGYVDQPSYLTEAMYAASANLTRWLCDRYGIPKVRPALGSGRAGIIGHNEIPDPDPEDAGKYGGDGRHRDPCVTLDGAQCFWNWNHYMELIGGTPSTPRGTLRGRVYSSAGGCTYVQDVGFQNCTRAVAGARVYVPESGDTQVANASGDFAFSLPPGSYTPQGDAPGYAPTTPVLGSSRVVAAGQTTWSSFILEEAATGTLRGFVYELDPANELERGRRVPGALVSAGSAVASASETGEFTLELPAGELSVTATRAGFNTTSAPVTIRAGEVTTLELGMLAGTEDLEPPRISFTRPAAGAVVRTNPLLVEGTVSEPLVSFEVNGSEALDQVRDGRFAVLVYQPLPGPVTITASGADAAGNPGGATLELEWVFDTGVQGSVRRADTGRPLGRAIVQSGELFTRTSGDGRFALTLPPGPRALTVHAPGFLPRSLAVTIPAEGTPLTQNLLLAPEAPALVTITSPVEGALVETTSVTMTGSVLRPRGGRVFVNEVEVAVTGEDTFSARVTLVPGENVLVARLRAPDGLESQATVTVWQGPKPCGCATGAEGGLGVLALLGLRRRPARTRRSR